MDSRTSQQVLDLNKIKALVLDLTKCSSLNRLGLFLAGNSNSLSNKTLYLEVLQTIWELTNPLDLVEHIRAPLDRTTQIKVGVYSTSQQANQLSLVARLNNPLQEAGYLEACNSKLNRITRQEAFLEVTHNSLQDLMQEEVVVFLETTKLKITPSNLLQEDYLAKTILNRTTHLVVSLEETISSRQTQHQQEVSLADKTTQILSNKPQVDSLEV